MDLHQHRQENNVLATNELEKYSRCPARLPHLDLLQRTLPLNACIRLLPLSLQGSVGLSSSGAGLQRVPALTTSHLEISNPSTLTLRI